MERSSRWLFATSLLLCGAALAHIACGNSAVTTSPKESPDDIVKAKVAAFDELGDAIDANDEAKARAAITRMREFERKRGHLPPEDQKAVNDKFAKEWGSAMDKWSAVGRKNPELLKKLDYRPWQQVRD